MRTRFLFGRNARRVVATQIGDPPADDRRPKTDDRLTTELKNITNQTFLRLRSEHSLKNEIRLGSKKLARFAYAFHPHWYCLKRCCVFSHAEKMHPRSWGCTGSMASKFKTRFTFHLTSFLNNSIQQPIATERTLQQMEGRIEQWQRRRLPRRPRRRPARRNNCCSKR